jgi:hypothetical protein
VSNVALRISAIDGTAFVDTDDEDFAAELTGNVGKLLIIEDSAGVQYRGWIKAIGTGEHYE